MSSDMAPDAGSSGTTQLTWEYLAHSEVGLVRKNNQDSGLVSADLLVVADGMGGAAAGDLASAVAADTLSKINLDESAEAADAETESARLRRLAAAISAANTRIADLVTTDYTLEGMGTTVTAAVRDGDHIGIAHIGDSRGYLFREGRLEQLTHDHSWVQSLIDEGKISIEEAAAHPHRSLLLKVLNGQPSNEPDLDLVQLRPGDRLLLCSDGLCGFVEDAEITEALRENRREAMDQLVDAAHAAGGLDNITIIIADIVDAAAADPEATASRTPLAARPTGRRTRAAAAIDAQEVDGPLEQPQLIGAAADRDLENEEEQIRDRAAQRASELDDDDDFVGDDYEDAEDLEDEDRYAPQVPRKRRWRRPLILTLVVVLVLAVASAAGFAWTRTQYYVGARNTDVAIFQGLNESVPGLPLSRVYEVQQLSLNDLPGYYQGLVRDGIETGTLESARETIRQLKETAARCSGGPTPASPSPTPSPSPHQSSTKPAHPSSSKSSPKTSASPKKSPTPKKTPSRPTTSSPAAPPESTPALTPQSSSSASTPGQLPGDGKC